MTKIYNSAKVCPHDSQECDKSLNGLSLDSDIIHILAHSRDYDHLTYLWQAWHTNSKPMRGPYKNYVNLMNKAAKLNELTDASEMWQLRYEHTNFANHVDQLWEQVEPLYDELHTYMKYKLKDIYGKAQLVIIYHTLPG